MAITNRFTMGWSDGGNSIAGAVTTAPGEEMVINETIPAVSTNLLVNLSVDVSTMLSVIFLADYAATIKTNSSGSPAATISLAAATPLLWLSTGGYPALSPFGATDVTALYVTSQSGGALQIAVGVDATP